MSGVINPIDKTFRGRVSSIEREITRLDRRLARPNGPSRISDTGQGTTNERDDYFGVPANLPERIRLANRQATWFNTDLGWLESYYIPSGTTGLTVKGLVAGVAPGWYPTGQGPEMMMQPTAQYSATAGNYVQGWSGAIRRVGGAAWFTNDQGSIIIQKAGYFDIRAWTIMQQGSGTANYHLVILNSANAQLTKHDGGAFPLNAGLYTTVDMSMSGTFMNVGDKVLLMLYGANSAINVHMGGGADTRGQLVARYTVPALVSD